MRCIAVLALAAGSLMASATYSVTDLGSFGTGSAVAYGISSTGQAAGWSQISGGMTHAFRTAGSGLVDLNGPGSESYAYGVNALGQTAGILFMAGTPHGVVWNGSGWIDFGADTAALAINDAGQVAGFNGHAMLYDGATHDLGTLAGGTWSAAYGINAAGAVVGYGDIGNGHFQGFIWTPATGMLQLGTLGGKDSYAMAVNAGGIVAGHSTLANGNMHAFISTGSGLQDLGTLGGASSYAYGINSSGWVVGYSTMPDGSQHAFVYLDGALMDLNTLIGENSGWVLTAAYGINDAGQIVGTGILNGQPHAFRLDRIRGLLTLAALETPETSSLELAAIGLLAILIAARRRRWRNRFMGAGNPGTGRARRAY